MIELDFYSVVYGFGLGICIWYLLEFVRKKLGEKHGSK